VVVEQKNPAQHGVVVQNEPGVPQDCLASSVPFVTVGEACAGERNTVVKARRASSLPIMVEVGIEYRPLW
jgi:hypothetical protein